MFFLKKTKYNNYMIKKLFLPLALSLSVAYSASAQDSTMVKFDFASTADSAKVYNATLCQGAKLINYGGANVLALGNDDGYFDFGADFGKVIGSLEAFTIVTDLYIPESTDITKNGNFVWCFANSSSTGYLFLGAKETRYAITKTSYSDESGVSLKTPLPKGKWINLTVVVKKLGTTGKFYANFYIDGSLGGSTSNISWTLSPKEIGNTIMNYLGKSCYNNDAYLKNAMFHDFRLYNYALPVRTLRAVTNMAKQNNVKLNQYADSLAIDEKINNATIELNTKNLMDDIELPTTVGDYAKVVWTTSNANVITADGTITRPVFGRPAATATLTATIISTATKFSEEGLVTKKLNFDVTVLPEFSDAETIAYDLEHLKIGGNINNVYDKLTLPTVGELGSVITWKSADTNWLTNTGRVVKQPDGKKQQVTLTATLMRGKERISHDYTVTIHEREPYSHYLFVYFPSNNNENLYYAISEDGYNYTPLNNGQAFFKAEGNTVMGGLRDPHILRGPDGNFYMAVTDMMCSKGWSSNRGLVLMKSSDLINWTCSKVHFPEKYAGTNFANVTRVWAPETIYDNQAGKYMVYFSLLTNDGTIPYDKDFYCYANDDFTDLVGEPTYLYDRGSATIDMDIVYNESDSLYHGFFKNEGQGGICKVTARTLTAPEGQPLGSQWSKPSPTLQQTNVAVEGAGVFKFINQDKWCLMYDCYTSGYYQFCSSDDLNKFTWEKNTTTSGAFTPRHGTVLPITAEEARKLLEAFPVDGLSAKISAATNHRIKQENLDIKAQEIFIPVEQGTDISAFDPMFVATPGAVVAPEGEQDFTKGEVTYTVSLNGQTKTYKVSVAAEGNPIIPGFHADPEVLLSKKTGRFYVYPTSDGYSGWGGYFFDVFSSPDLVHFTNEGTILNLSAGHDAPWASGNAWAPCIEEKWVDGKWKYFYYFSAHNASVNKKTLGVAVAENPTGPFKASKAPLFTSTSGGQMIDSDVFTDPVSGQSYLYYGNGQLHYRLLNDDMISVGNTEYTITPQGGSLADYAFREGVYVFYRNGLYYFLWSVDDTGSKNYHVAYGTSTSPTGPITVAKEPVILIQDADNEIYGTAHNSIVNIPDTDEWYIVYHRINKKYLSNGPGYHREVCVDKLAFNADGTIKRTIPTRKGIDPIDTTDLINGTTAVKGISTSDSKLAHSIYYSVEGKMLGNSKPTANGIYVRQEIMTDGSSRAMKVMVK